MRNYLLSAFLLCCTLGSIAQDKASAFEKKSERLNQPTKWIKKDGGWIDSKKMTYDSKSAEIVAKAKTFEWMQMGATTIGGKKYHILFWTHRIGSSSDVVMTFAFVMDDQEYGQLKAAVNAKAGKDVKIKAKVNITIPRDPQDQSVITAAKGEIAQAQSTPGAASMMVNAQTTKDGDVVRFDMPDIYIFEESLNQSYFQAPIADFKKLLID
jgi:hypothetical protein